MGTHGVTQFHEPHIEYNNHTDTTNYDTCHWCKSRLRLKDTTTPHGTACQANPVTCVLAQIGFRPMICNNIWIRITIDRLEMLQLRVNDIFIAVHDLSPDTYKPQHNYKNDLITMQSVGSNDIPTV
jgi:hypothetical protein